MFNHNPNRIYRQSLPQQYYPHSMDGYVMYPNYGLAQPRPAMYPNYPLYSAGFHPYLNYHAPYENKIKGFGHDLFQNPLQPDDGYFYGTPNPKVAFQHGNPQKTGSSNNKQGGNSNSILNSFKSQDGTYDINKMVNTTGQLVNALSQVSSMAKGIGGFFKL
ncbi:YppG family protein [Lederbergia lenta]|uniref:Spore coat protein n=1 Tax=Lederbergia lenta TaxID=1467 RepID=A0A2X4Z7J4_LEDLE|nr:YppG family protein [Lederbergia lenta]MCM3109308.1 YppG family protein [Lederbergia lenta]MEC2324926.1 YppG family protein [Lederbergia lenta]SQI56614.1 spore coat protein [Lederbergia lenta]